MNLLLNPSNHLFELARRGRRLPHLILAIVLGFVFVLLAQMVGGIPFLMIMAVGQQLPLDNPEALTASLQPDTALEQTLFLVMLFTPIFLLLWLWLALFEKRPFWTIGLEWAGAGWKYARGLGVGLVMFGAAAGLMAVLGYVEQETGERQAQGAAALGGVLLVLLGWVVQGAAEEAIARGWLLPVIGARYRPGLGVVLSALVFAVYHSLNPNLSPVAVLNLFLFGLFAALYALFESGLWGVFALHTAWNWSQGNLFGFEVSGAEPAGGMLVNLAETGPDALTGGAFGPEGGLLVTLVLLVASAVVWLICQRRQAL